MDFFKKALNWFSGRALHVPERDVEVVAATMMEIYDDTPGRFPVGSHKDNIQLYRAAEQAQALYLAGKIVKR